MLAPIDSVTSISSIAPITIVQTPVISDAATAASDARLFGSNSTDNADANATNVNTGALNASIAADNVARAAIGALATNTSNDFAAATATATTETDQTLLQQQLVTYNDQLAAAQQAAQQVARESELRIQQLQRQIAALQQQISTSPINSSADSGAQIQAAIEAAQPITPETAAPSVNENLVDTLV